VHQLPDSPQRFRCSWRSGVTTGVATAVCTLLLSSGVHAQSPAPPPPLGLWQNAEEGMVMRIEACGDAFCGVTAGVPSEKAKGRTGNCAQV
jgi:uncharacterized protein (DUF2147 family)